MRVENISWKNHPIKDLWRTAANNNHCSQKRVIFASHCCRAKDQLISDICYGFPNLPEETGLIHFLTQSPGTRDQDQFQELGAAVADRTQWKDMASKILTAGEG